MANKVIIDIEARLLDNVSKGAHSAAKALDDMGTRADKQKKKLDQLNKTNVKPKVGADDSKFTRAMNKTQRLLKKLDSSKATAILDAMDRATQKISSAHNKAKTFASNWKAKLGIDSGDSTRVIDRVTNGLKNIAGKTWRGTLRVIDAATSPIRTIFDSLFNLKNMFMGVVGAMAANKLVIQPLITQPIALADAYSGAKIGFSTLLGETAGQEMMNQLDEFAKVTPFKTSNVIANAQKMMAMGWDPEDIIGDMEVIGNAAAATGKLDTGLESIVRALSQIKTKGKLSTEELNQLAEAGIAAKGMLAEQLGYGTGDTGIAKMTKDLEDGKIASDKAIQALLAGMQQYDGMMDSMANETVEGLKSQLEDAFEINVARRWGQGLQDGAKRGLGTVISLLDDADDALNEFGDTVHEIGSAIGNWAADKLENAVKRISEITGSYEFKNADLGEKIKMLWKGVIVDPLGEWWEDGGRDKTVETAGKIGKSMGEFLSTAIKGILGITDIFEDGGIDASGGMSIAQSFAKGFVDGFDVSGVTEKLKEAISDVWNALPWWGKALVGGYIGGKAISGIGSVFSGIGSIVGGAGKVIGSTGNAMVGGSGISGLLAGLGYKLTGGGGAGAYFGAGMSGGVAAGAGLGAITAGVGAIHVGKTAYDAYKAYKDDDKTSMWANIARSGSTAAGIGAGALVGAKAGAAIGSIGGPAGTLIGAGLGTVVGWFAGDKIAKNIEAAKYESEDLKKAIKDSNTSAEELAETFEQAVWANQKSHFGDIKLSLEEIERLSNQIVFGDDTSTFDQMATAANQAKSSYESMVSSAGNMERWMWKAGLGVKFNDDEKESFKASVDEYIESAKSYVENKHYEFTAAVSVLVDTKSKAGEGILSSGNKFYGKMEKKLEKAGKDLGDELTKALKDGIIEAKEQEAITAAQQKIAEITNKISQSEMTAEMDLIKLKFGGGQITAESFENMQSQLQTSIDERISKMDEAFTTSVSSIRLQVAEGALSPEEAEKQINELAKGYKAQIDEVKAEVKKVQIDILADAYAGDLGKNAADKLSTALDKAMEEGIDPKTWTLEDAQRLLGVESLTGETATAIGQYLGSIADQLESMDVDGKLNVNITVESEGGEKVKEEVDKTIPDSFSKTIGVDITGEKRIQNTLTVLVEDFGIEKEHAETLAILLSGEKEILNKIDASTLAEEFGIPESKAEEILMKLKGEKTITGKVNVLAKEFGVPDDIAETLALVLTGNKEIGNSVTVSAADFGIKDSYSKTVTLKISAVAKKIGNAWNNLFGDGEGFRGGLYGGKGQVPGFSDGGYVKGGAQLITVAEEGDPEVIIPLSQRRRDRAMDLWRQTGEILHADFGGKYATGGIVGANEGGPSIDRSAPVVSGGAVGGGDNHITIEVGGIELNVKVEGGQDAVEAIQAQKEQLAEEIAGIINSAIEAQYQNMPAKKGA